MMKRTTRILLLLLVTLVATNSFLFSFTVTVDSCGQWTDGSRLFDIWYTLEGVNDCVEITILPITTITNETLLCETFIEPSDTGIRCESGSYHIVWEVGTDIPEREFYSNKIKIEIIAAKPGIIPGNCFNVCGETEVVEVTNPVTGEIWMDRNLGASQQATAYYDFLAYGALFQWGRLSDGHECIDWLSSDSGIPDHDTTNITSFTDEPGHSMFILCGGFPYDWRNPQNDALWQGVSGINNPCPTGFRLPTRTELNNERISWISNNLNGAYVSPLKFIAGGYRTCRNGMVGFSGIHGYYWSSTINGPNTWNLNITNSSASIDNNGRAEGFCVRCIKD